MTRATVLRRYWSAPVIIVVAAVTAGVFVWGGRRDEAARARVGQVFDAMFAFDESVTVTDRTLRVPDGQLDLTTTEPLPSAPSALNVPDRLAPSGGYFVGVRVRANGAKSLPVPVAADGAADGAEDPAVSVALVVDGRSYVLPQPFRPSAAGRPIDRFAWVAVAGSARTVGVAVRYEGVTQRIDMRTGKRTSGVADPLYRLTPGPDTRRSRQCDAPTAVTGGFRVPAERGIECAFRTLGGLPYLPGHGWAPRGSVWFTVLVGIETTAPRFERGGASYRATIGGDPPTLTASAADRAAVDAALPQAQYSPVTGGQGYVAAVRVPVGTTPALTVVATYRDLVRTAVATAPTVAAGPEVSVTWTVRS